ncbi:MAG: HEXXH motif-containing putative peptide modification protein [Methylovirgula sp.]|uniref:aKG-HExxH-type peptide beta-hydroxylase n=1 Tax=Methylovirgula sp. TaxID=1978224 RepID=UPI0030760E7A
MLNDIVPPAEFGTRGRVVVEELDLDISAPYRAMGLDFVTSDDVVRTGVVPRLNAALSIISSIPDLASALGDLLWAIHVLKTPDADYDVSHSDPGIPFSVFIGVSAEPGPLDRIRLAEELVHECMHLQLTLLEAQHILVCASEERLPSPWQGRLRPTRGVLHGFYVFSVLDAFFSRLAAASAVNPIEAAHVRARRHEIGAELDVAANALATSYELTEDGRILVSELTYPDAMTARHERRK